MSESWRKESVYRDGSLNYGRLALYAIMIFVAIVWGAPFIWMFVTSIKPDNEVFSYPPTWWPNEPTLEFYTRLFDSFPMLQWFRNSLIVATITTVLTLATNILAAYPLARMRFRGRKIVLLIILSTFLLPGEILLVPLFLGMIKFKLANTYFSIAVPAAANAFGVFLMTQFFLTIPVELEEAGRLDGCSRFGLLWRIFIPLSKPVIATVAIFTFVRSWNDFFWPLIISNTDATRTVPVGLAVFVGRGLSMRFGVIMASAAAATIPAVIFFLLLAALLRPRHLHHRLARLSARRVRADGKILRTVTVRIRFPWLGWRPPEQRHHRRRLRAGNRRAPDAIQPGFARLPLHEPGPAGQALHATKNTPAMARFYNWKNYGGAKTWPAPQGWDGEGQWPGPPDPVLDSGRYDFQTSEASVLMTSPPDERSGLRIRRQFTLRPGSSCGCSSVCFFENVLNRDDTLVDLGCRADACSHAPDGQLNDDCWLYIPTDPANRERPYEVMFGDDNPQYQLDTKTGLLAVQYQGIVGKIGVHSPAGWIAFADKRAGYVLCMQFPYEPDAEYPDNGATVECWTESPGAPSPIPIRSPGYILEAEVLSPLSTLQPLEIKMQQIIWSAAKLARRRSLM